MSTIFCWSQNFSESFSKAMVNTLVKYLNGPSNQPILRMASKPVNHEQIVWDLERPSITCRTECYRTQDRCIKSVYKFKYLSKLLVYFIRALAPSLCRAEQLQAPAYSILLSSPFTLILNEYALLFNLLVFWTSHQSLEAGRIRKKRVANLN